MSHKASMAAFPRFLLLLLAFAPTCFALFQTSSSSGGALSAEEGSAVYVALNNLVSKSNGFNASNWYSSGFAFANVQSINGKRIAIRYVRWTEDCTAGNWESAPGALVLEDFRTTVPYLRPYLLQGYSWAAVSNGYAWVDYSLLDKIEETISLPGFGSMSLNVSNSDQTANIDVSVEPYSSSRLLLSMVSRLSPVDKTGFVDCPVSPLVLLSHNNGVWDVLRAGESLTSHNKRMRLEMQRDCNLNLTDTQSNEVLWNSHTYGRGKSCFLRLQSDANMVIYDGNEDNPVWAINQGCGKGCVKFSALVVEDDGNLVVYRSETQNDKLSPVWATNTKV